MHIAVVGAGGGLGRLVATRLLRAGHAVHAVARADARDPRAIAALAPDVIVSCAGASVALARGKGWRGYGAVDVPLGLAAVDAALHARARLVYVGAVHAPALATTAYVAAHERVAAAARALPSATIVRATGFFSAFAALLPLAARGTLVDLGVGAARSNPIDERDLAAIVARAATYRDTPRELAAGGPDTFARRDLIELVAAAAARRCGRPVRVRAVPTWLAAGGALALRCVHPRLGQLARFVVGLARHDCIAPALGTSHLADYLDAAVADPRAAA